MIKIYLKELNKHIYNNFSNFYLLVGDKDFLLNYSQNKIIKEAKNKKFTEILRFNINLKTNWQIIFYEFQKINLFFTRRIFLINMLDIKINKNLLTNILKILNFLNSDTILIIKINKIYNKLITDIFINLNKEPTLIFCEILEIKNISQWIIFLSKRININLDEESKNLICLYYENNLSALSNLLKLIKVRFPTEHFIKINQIKKLILDSTDFSIINWIKCLLSGNLYYALIFLKIIYKENNFLNIIRTLQKYLVIFIKIKKHSNEEFRKLLFDKYHIEYSDRLLIIKLINRINEKQIFYSIKIINRIDIKNFNKKILFVQLKKITIILCCSLSLNYLNKSKSIIKSI